MEQERGRRCVFCGAHTARHSTTTVDGGRHGAEVVIRGVPAVCCATCGEAAIDEPLASVLSEAMDTILTAIEQNQTARAESRANT
jgi:YgiT-type zinc finger domain-containing protein